MGKDRINKLREALMLCTLHHQRMAYAIGKVECIFPLDEGKYTNLQPDDLSYLDQLIFRFAKLQDSMGNRLFPAILENLGEDLNEKPFIDILTTLEKLHLIENHKDWLKLRETRNIVTHEYPFFAAEIVEGLNELKIEYKNLERIWLNLKNYCKARFDL